MSCITVVPVGSVGVISVLGSVKTKPFESGWHFVTPGVTTVTLLSTRLHAVHFADEVPTSEGVTVHLEASCINALDPMKAVQLFQSVGTDFEMKVLMPEFQSVVRSITSGHTSQSLYTAKARDAMSHDLMSNLSSLVGPRGITVQAALINKLQLPATIEASIEKKMAREQQAEQMKYILQKQEKVKQQLAIQADGIATAQRILSSGIDERLLRWKGIETTKSLSGSCNPKLIIIGGGGSSQLPIVLNQGFSDNATTTIKDVDMMEVEADAMPVPEPIRAVHREPTPNLRKRRYKPA